ncbi:MAG: zinc-finger domain-containing protein [Fluviicola sp.]
MPCNFTTCNMCSKCLMKKHHRKQYGKQSFHSILTQKRLV